MITSRARTQECASVRPARKADLALLKGMASRLFDEVMEQTMDRHALGHLDERKRELLKDVPVDTTWVAKHEGEVCGLVMVVRDLDAARIAALYVVLSQRNRGIGTALVETALNAVCSGLPVVVETLIATSPFYVRMGFISDPQRPWLLIREGKTK